MKGRHASSSSSSSGTCSSVSLTATSGRSSGGGGPHAHQQAAAALSSARRLVLWMLLALGSLTLVTAGLLLAQTLDRPPDALVWFSAASQQLAAAGGRVAVMQQQPQEPQLPRPQPPGQPAAARPAKELDPDFVVPPASSGGAAAAYAGKRCPQGCEQHGNCNAEEGRCECPFGWVGPACQQPLFPACKLAANASEMHCGDRFPRSCECLRQCRAFFCGGSGKGRCETPRDVWYVRCFERAPGGGGGSRQAAAPANASRAQAGAPPPRGPVYSDVPEEGEEAAGLVTWYRGIRSDLQREKLTRAQATAVGPLAPGGPGMVALPMSKCPGSCMRRGQCVATGRGAAPRCVCWQGYGGASCDQVLALTCVNACSGRGTCRGGFCHCRAGFWGRDCSRSRAFPPHNTHSSVTGLKIYVYELPTHLAFDLERFVGFQGHDPLYIAYKAFNAALLQDWAVRTENPWEANLFYVPALTYAYSSNLGDVSEHLRRVVTWVAGAHPFFNRTRGSDHFVFLTQDRGACWIAPADPLLGRLIKVVHFGFAQRNTQLPGDFQLMPGKGAGCFRPGRDVVAAPYTRGQEALARETYGNGSSPGTLDAAGAAPWARLLFFAGSINADEPDYSGGVRQELWRLHKAGKLGRDVLVSAANNLTNFSALMRSSRFCFAPYGHGWGNRLTLAVVHGCVPVVVQDGVHQPFEELLPYHEFSVRLPLARLASITQVLSRVSEAEHAALRAGLRRWWPAFVWLPEAGGRAYTYTIASLQRRAVGHLAGHDARRRRRRH